MQEPIILEEGGKTLSKSKKGLFVCLILLQALICLFCFTGYRKEQTIFDFDADDFETDAVFIENFLDSKENGYYIDNSSESVEDFASTPEIDLKRGMYEITIYYQTNNHLNAYNINADNADYREKTGNYHKNLPQDRKNYTIELWASRKLENFVVELDFEDGYFFVSRIEIRENRNWMIGTGILLLILFSCLDCLCFFYKKWKTALADREWRNQLLAFTLIVFFASLPLCISYLFDGHDIMFHLLRIEGIRDGMQSGHFPVRMQPNWLNGYGYGVSIFYGDILLYFPAVLRIFGCSVQNAFKWFVLFMNIMTAGIAYYCFKRLFHSAKLGLLGSLLHTASIYRLICIYVRGSVGEFCALTFFPLILVSIYEILWKKDENIPKDSWILGVFGFCGLITCHIISTELMAVLVLTVCFVHFRKAFRPKALLEFVKMGFGIIACSLWFLLPFIDMWTGGEYWVKSAENGYFIQTQGEFFANLFNLFPYIEGDGTSFSVVEGIGLKGELNLSVGGGLLAGGLFFVIYWNNYGKKEDKHLRMGIHLFFLSAVLAVMTTVVFPWDDLQFMGGLWKFMIQNIQFPWRLFGLLTLTLTTLTCLTVQLFGCSGQEKKEKTGGMILLLTVLSTGYLISSILHNNHTIYLHSAEELDTYHIVGGEYMPVNAVIDKEEMGQAQATASEGISLEHIERAYLEFRITCSNTKEEEGYIDLPLLYYKGYQTKTAPEAEKLTNMDNERGHLRVLVPGNFTGTIEIDYVGEWYWRATEIISLAGMIVLLILFMNIQLKRSIPFMKNSAFMKNSSPDIDKSVQKG